MGSNWNNNDNNKLEQTICLLSTEFIQFFLHPPYSNGLYCISLHHEIDQ